MDRLRMLRVIRSLVAVSYAVGIGGALPLRAAEPDATPPGRIATAAVSLDSARELIKGGDYDRAIEVLKLAIAEGHRNLPQLREAYLLLIKTYVFLGNDLKFKPQGREASNLNYKAARELIAECLRIRELRHTQPEPASEYPPEMISAFAEVRGQIFGSFRVVSLDPPGATVLLGADTLRTLAVGNMLGDTDLAVGPHLVVVRAPGFKDVTDEILISPNSTLERSYELSRSRSRTWYAAVATGAVGVVGGLVALMVRGGEQTSAAAAPLPGPPAPPSNP